MTHIVVKDGPARDPWPAHKQIIAHVLGDNTRVDPALRIRGRNRWGMPEGVFFYGNDRTVQQPFVVDIDVTERVDRAQGQYGIFVLGIHFMCPRCMQALYMRTAESPGGAGRPSHEIEVHWLDQRVISDGYWRPTFTVGGPVRCENHLRTSPRYTQDSLGFCNWRGGIIRGRCLDHR